MSTERPILFSGAMVRAILAGQKTMTRRVVKGVRGAVSAHWYPSIGAAQFRRDDGRESLPVASPYGQPGGRLWVRETWGKLDMGSACYRADDEAAVPADGRWRPSIHMPRWASRMTLEVVEVRVQRLQEISEEDALAEGIKTQEHWASSSMSAWCYFSGDPHPGRDTHPPADPAKSPCYETAQLAFRALWDSINGERPGCSWEANPWVWAITFRRLP